MFDYIGYIWILFIYLRKYPLRVLHFVSAIYTRFYASSVTFILSTPSSRVKSLMFGGTFKSCFALQPNGVKEATLKNQSLIHILKLKFNIFKLIFTFLHFLNSMCPM